MKQLDIFIPEIQPKVHRTYSMLSIHQKINYKANSCGFQQIVYRSRYNYFQMGVYNEVIDRLTDKYWWHHCANSGAENRMKAYAESKGQKQLSFNQ